MSEAISFCVYFRTAVSIILERLTQNTLLPPFPTPDYIFPDGSWLFDQPESHSKLNHYLSRYGCHFKELEQSGPARTLAPHRKLLVVFIYANLYQRRIGKYRFCVCPRFTTPETPDEWCLNRLEVALEFRKDIDQRPKTELHEVITDWHRSLITGSHLDFGNATLVDSSMEMNGRWAKWRIDATQLMVRGWLWLIVVILDFGHRSHTVMEVYFDHPALRLPREAMLRRE